MATFNPELSGKQATTISSNPVENMNPVRGLAGVVDLFQIGQAKRAAEEKAQQEAAVNNLTADATRLYMQNLAESEQIKRTQSTLGDITEMPALDITLLNGVHTSIGKMSLIPNEFERQTRMQQEWQKITQNPAFPMAGRQTQDYIAGLFEKNITRDIGIDPDIKKELDNQGLAYTPENVYTVTNRKRTKATQEFRVSQGEFHNEEYLNLVTVDVQENTTEVLQGVYTDILKVGAVTADVQQAAKEKLLAKRQSTLDSLTANLQAQIKIGDVVKSDQIKKSIDFVNQQYDDAVKFMDSESVQSRMKDVTDIMDYTTKIKFPFVSKVLTSGAYGTSNIAVFRELTQLSDKDFENMFGVPATEKSRQALWQQAVDYMEAAQGGVAKMVQPGSVDTKFLNYLSQKAVKAGMPGAKETFWDHSPTISGEKENADKDAKQFIDFSKTDSARAAARVNPQAAKASWLNTTVSYLKAFSDGGNVYVDPEFLTVHYVYANGGEVILVPAQNTLQALNTVAQYPEYRQILGAGGMSDVIKQSGIPTSREELSNKKLLPALERARDNRKPAEAPAQWDGKVPTEQGSVTEAQNTIAALTAERDRYLDILKQNNLA